MGFKDDKPLSYWFLSLGILASIFILLATAIKLAVIKHEYFKNLSRDNRVVESIIPAARGEILDRKGRVVAKSIYQYFSIEDGVRMYENEGEFHGYKFEGKDLAYDLKRQYNYGPSLGLLSGYVGKINQEDVNKSACLEFSNNGDVVGRGGVEEIFDCELRGKNGRRLIEVDAMGKYVREMGRDEPVAGQNLSLSIDAYWQELIYKMLAGQKAVVIMSEPKTGKILALVSSPSYDPNNFSYRQNNELITNYLNDNNGLPMLNRAVAARYHPGSVFKLAVATGGLESGVINKDTLIEDTGVIKVGDYNYNNWLWTKRGATDGMVNIVKALQRSNDIFFYKLGESLGVARIKTWADKFGYGQKTGIEVPGELEGLVPDDKWKEKAKGEKWFLGNTYHMAIGQGDVGVTPLQVNEMTNIVANKGIKCKPTVLKDKKPDCQNIGASRESFNIVIEGMKAACLPGGTAWPLFNFKTPLACKTGTAEVGDGSAQTHAWLTVFAPADDPQISLTVLVERGGEGSDVAAPIAGDILKLWLEEEETVVPRYTPTPGVK